jgi:hypothetical protein
LLYDFAKYTIRQKMFFEVDQMFGRAAAPVPDEWSICTSRIRSYFNAYKLEKGCSHFFRRKPFRVARWFIFIPKIPIWVHVLWRALEWRMLVYFMTSWNILGPFGIFYGSSVYVVCGHLAYFSRFGMFEPRKIWQPWNLSRRPVDT